MDWSSVIYAGIGGGIGGLLATALASLIEKNRGSGARFTNLRAGLAAAFVVIGLNVTTLLYKNMTLPRIIPMDTTVIADELPYFKYIEESEPGSYEKLITSVDKMTRGGAIDQKNMDAFRAELQQIVAAKQRSASAATLRVQNDVHSELLTILSEKAPAVCTQKFYSRSYQVLDDIVGEDFRQRENQAMALYFTEAPRPVSYKPDLARGESLFNDVIRKIVDDLAVTNLDPPIVEDKSTDELHRKICSLQIELNKASSALSDDDMLHVVEYLGSEN